MKGKSYTKDFKEQIFKEVEEIKNVSVVAKKHGLPNSTIHTWLRKRDKKIDFKSKINSKFEHLPKENKKLKKQLEEKELENQILRDLLKKTYQVWNTD